MTRSRGNPMTPPENSRFLLSFGNCRFLTFFASASSRISLRLMLARRSTNPRMQVLPPANGKKLWRVKRSVSLGNPASADANSSLQCLNSSLRITAACKQFMSKRPPLKRPKLKPGMMKDFVFVDLSPVKTETEEISPALLHLLMSLLLLLLGESPIFDKPQDFSFDDYDSSLLGLGLMNMPAEYPQPSVAELALQMQQEQLAFQRFLQFQSQFGMQNGSQLQQMNTQMGLLHVAVTPNLHQRSKLASLPRRKSGEFQFKSYKGPGVRKPKHKRCVSESAVKRKSVTDSEPENANLSPLQDFLHAPKDSDISLDYSQTWSLDDIEQFDLAYTPLTDLLDFENVDTLHKPIDLDMHCDNSQLFKDEFDMSNFVSI